MPREERDDRWRLHRAGIINVYQYEHETVVVDYEAALRRADEREVRLDRDERPCGETPWDPDLASTFNRDRLIVHEEFVLPELFSDSDW